MADLKTRPSGASVEAFLQGVDDEARREDCRTVLALMRRVTGAEPEMWGPSIVGFGRYHYRYASGREGDWFLTGFSPRKRDLTLYIMAGFSAYDDLLAKLGTPQDREVLPLRQAPRGGGPRGAGGAGRRLGRAHAGGVPLTARRA